MLRWVTWCPRPSWSGRRVVVGAVAPVVGSGARRGSALGGVVARPRRPPPWWRALRRRGRRTARARKAGCRPTRGRVLEEDDEVERRRVVRRRRRPRRPGTASIGCCCAPCPSSRARRGSHRRCCAGATSPGRLRSAGRRTPSSRWPASRWAAQRIGAAASSRRAATLPEISLSATCFGSARERSRATCSSRSGRRPGRDRLGALSGERLEVRVGLQRGGSRRGVRCFGDRRKLGLAVS